MKRKDKVYIILGLVAGFIFLLYYFGLVQDIQFQEQEVGPFKVVYQTHLGDYSKMSNIAKGIDLSLRENGINSTKIFRIYYDNPNNVAKKSLRGEAGMIIDEKDFEKINELKGKYNVKDIAKAQSIVSIFPYKGSFSIWLGAFRVYPQLEIYLEEKGYSDSPIMEIYDTENNKIIYLVEI